MQTLALLFSAKDRAILSSGHGHPVLAARPLSATTNPLAEAALDQLAKLRGLDVHTSVIVGSVDEGDTCTKPAALYTAFAGMVTPEVA